MDPHTGVLPECCDDRLARGGTATIALCKTVILSVPLMHGDSCCHRTWCGAVLHGSDTHRPVSSNVQGDKFLFRHLAAGVTDPTRSFGAQRFPNDPDRSRVARMFHGFQACTY